MSLCQQLAVILGPAQARAGVGDAPEDASPLSPGLWGRLSSLRSSRGLKVAVTREAVGLQDPASLSSACTRARLHKFAQVNQCVVAN